MLPMVEAVGLFQHTAARRRLAPHLAQQQIKAVVSTHSRPKAAGNLVETHKIYNKFQHTAARRRLDYRQNLGRAEKSFNTQPPEGG